jgi:hypothetical protein
MGLRGGFSSTCTLLACAATSNVQVLESAATLRRVEGHRDPVKRQVGPAVEADQLGQDGGQRALGKVEGKRGGEKGTYLK